MVIVGLFSIFYNQLGFFLYYYCYLELLLLMNKQRNELVSLVKENHFDFIIDELRMIGQGFLILYVSYH